MKLPSLPSLPQLKAPKFWYKNKSTLGTLLYPLGSLYAWISRYEQSLHTPTKVKTPVICVGNLTLGGSGKTPTTLAIADLLKELNLSSHILTRGYGGKPHIAHQVTNADTPERVGDEACLMARHFPVWVGKNRGISAVNAMRAKAQILLMDDGLQHQTLHKNIKIVVVDGAQGFGNERVFPAGPLRTSLREGFVLADAFILIHPTAALEELLKLSGKPIFTAKLKPQLPIRPQEVIAFAGIGYPEKFHTFLEEHGFKVLEFLPFPDHHNYKEEDLEAMKELQQKFNLPVLTTEKDAIKIPHGVIPELFIVPVTLEFDQKKEFTLWLIKMLEMSVKADTLN